MHPWKKTDNDRDPFFDCLPDKLQISDIQTIFPGEIHIPTDGCLKNPMKDSRPTGQTSFQTSYYGHGSLCLVMKTGDWNSRKTMFHSRYHFLQMSSLDNPGYPVKGQPDNSPLYLVCRAMLYMPG